MPKSARTVVEESVDVLDKECMKIGKYMDDFNLSIEFLESDEALASALTKLGALRRVSTAIEAVHQALLDLGNEWKRP